MKHVILCTESGTYTDYLNYLKSFLSKEADFHEFSLSDLQLFSHYLRSEDNVFFLEYLGNPETRAFLKHGLERVRAKVILLVDVTKLSKELIAELEQNPKIFSVVDKSHPFEISLPLVRSVLTYSSLENESKEMKKLTLEMDEMIRFTLNELQKVKRLHEQVVPLRNEELKGLRLFSKFAAGESPGGDFFDIIKMDKQLVVLLTSSRSYLASSIILSHFEKLRSENRATQKDLENFIFELSSELREVGILRDDSENGIEILIHSIDINTMNIFGYNFGGAKVLGGNGPLVSQNEYPINSAFSDKAYFEYKLERGTKIFVTSSGIPKNLGESTENIDTSKFIKNLLIHSGKEALNELFFQLKKESGNDFLDYDASAIHIEVLNNAILQV